MICPHCNQNLLRKERGDRTCSTCKQRFALEPKESTYGLHDLRLLKLVEKLSAGRGLYSTVTQLRYTAARRRLPNLKEAYWTIVGSWVAIVVVPTYLLSILVGAALGSSRWWMIPLCGLLVLVIGLAVIRASWPLLRSARTSGCRSATKHSETTYSIRGHRCTAGCLPGSCTSRGS